MSLSTSVENKEKPDCAGITSNPLILQRDQVPQCNLKVYKVLAQQVRDKCC